MFFLRNLTLGMKIFVISFLGMFFGFLVIVLLNWFILFFYPLFGCEVSDLGNHYYCQIKNKEIVYTTNLKHDLDHWDCYIAGEVIIPNVLQIAHNDTYIGVSSISQEDNKIVYWIIHTKAEKKIIGDWNITEKFDYLPDNVHRYNRYSNIDGPLSQEKFEQKNKALKWSITLPPNDVKITSKESSLISSFSQNLYRVS